MKGETHFALRGTRQTSISPMQDVPRVFSRQTARFEILDSQSLRGMYTYNIFAFSFFF